MMIDLRAFCVNQRQTGSTGTIIQGKDDLIRSAIIMRKRRMMIDLRAFCVQTINCFGNIQALVLQMLFGTFGEDVFDVLFTFDSISEGSSDPADVIRSCF